MLIAAGIAWYVRSTRRPVTSPTEYVQLTNFSDYATAPALSPDGRMVAFFRGGPYFLGSGQVYVKLLPDGESKQLTNDATLKYDPVFTPDGSRVAYTAQTLGLGQRTTWDTWTVPVLGGSPTRLMSNAAGLSFMGGGRVLFSEIMQGTPIHMGVVTSLASRAEEHEIYFPSHERAMAHYSWPSPDQQSVLIVEMDRTTAWQRCRVAPMDGSSAGAQVGPPGACTASGWSPDGRWMYLNVETDGSTHLWRQRVPDGTPEQITFGPTEEEGLAVSPDGKSLVASIGNRHSSVWLHDSSGDHTVPVEGSVSAPRLSADGKRLYYLLLKTNSPGVQELWSRDLDSGKSDPVLTGQRIVDYDISRDQARVAFTVRGGNTSQIFLAALDRGSAPRLVTKDGDLVSFGGGGLVFRQLGDKASYMARINEDGSGLERVLDKPIVETVGVSPDGDWVVATDGKTFAWSIGKHLRRDICAGYCATSWSADGKYLYVTTNRSATSAGRTLAIPIPQGFASLVLPESGLDRSSEEELAGMRAVVIRKGVLSPGPDPETYAFTKAEFQGNLFRIPLH
jgi:Tol biopolymer transport system component